MLMVTMTILLSCQRKVKFKAPPDEVRKDTGVMSSELTDPEKERYRKSFKGLYSYGKGVSTFYDCGTRTVYWLTDSTGRLARLYENSERVLPYPNESVYVELTGYLKGGPANGSASGYADELVARDVIRLKPKDYRTECYPYEYVALGNEPFWSLEIIPHEKRMVFKDIGAQKVYEFPYAPAVPFQGGITYQAGRTGQGNSIQVTIREQVCSDGMSDRRYNHSATVVLNGRSYKGCAIRKGERI